MSCFGWSTQGRWSVIDKRGVQLYWLNENFRLFLTAFFWMVLECYSVNFHGQLMPPKTGSIQKHSTEEDRNFPEKSRPATMKTGVLGFFYGFCSKMSAELHNPLPYCPAGFGGGGQLNPVRQKHFCFSTQPARQVSNWSLAPKSAFLSVRFA